MTIGEKIYLLRQKLDIKQRDLAERAGITEATLSRYENGKRNPSGDVVAKIANVLGVTSDYLLGSDDKPNLKVKEEKQSPEVETIAAHLEGKNITPKKMKLIKNYIDALFDDDEF